MDKEVHIEIVVPYETKRRLGESMNLTMQRLDIGDWCIFIDSDILMITPHDKWYSACINLIQKEGYKVGFASCTTNRIGCSWQEPDIEIDKENDDIKYHYFKGYDLWQKKALSYDMPGHGQLFSGMFIMTHKQAWLDAGRFNEGWQVDNWYDKAVVKAGYHRAILQGVYCYHMYKKKEEWREEIENKK